MPLSTIVVLSICDVYSTNIVASEHDRELATMIVRNVEEIVHVCTCKARTCFLIAKDIIVLYVYLFIEIYKQIEFVEILLNSF